MVKASTITDEIKRKTLEINKSKSDLKRIKKLGFNSLYFPDYRRIEEDSSNLGYKNLKLQDKTTALDETIKSFVNVCNKYLNPSKQIIYNESAAEIYIEQTRNNENIELSNLSSGEKQIISLFSKVYIEAKEDFILIIDEPELSISVEWQQMLLPDIMKSGKCKRLIAATHSPFISKNELEPYARSLNEFVTEINTDESE
ncbi:AAA family ATPase [Crocosphaera sp. Alani8]